MLIDKNGIQIKEGDWIRYVYGEDGEIGGMQVVSQNGELGVIQSNFLGSSGWSKKFVNLKDTDLQHCEVVEHGKKKEN